MRALLSPCREQGFVLITVLGLLSALLMMGLALGTVTRTDLAQARRFQDETAAEFLARAGVEWTLHYLNTLERQDGFWQAPWRHQPELFQGHTLGAGGFEMTYVDETGSRRYGLWDEEARLHLNTAPGELLQALPGVTPQLAAAIVQQRRQRPFAALEELRTRQLVDGDTLYGTAEQPGLSAYLTVWGSGKINLNTAAAPVLAALPGMTAAMATAIVQQRAGSLQSPSGAATPRPFRGVDDLAALPGFPPTTLSRLQAFLTVSPTAFQTIVTGRVTGPQQTRREARWLVVIDRGAKPVRLQYWRRVS